MPTKCIQGRHYEILKIQLVKYQIKNHKGSASEIEPQEMGDATYFKVNNVLTLLNMTRGNMQYPRTLAVLGISTPWGDIKFKIRNRTEQPTTATP
jgi:hypothetical protein